MEFSFIKYLNNFYNIYINNILIFSDNIANYKNYVKKVLAKFCKTGLQANIDKYKFNIIKTKFLNFIISMDRLKIDLEKIAVLKD